MAVWRQVGLLRREQFELDEERLLIVSHGCHQLFDLGFQLFETPGWAELMRANVPCQWKMAPVAGTLGRCNLMHPS